MRTLLALAPMAVCGCIIPAAIETEDPTLNARPQILSMTPDPRFGPFLPDSNGGTTLSLIATDTDVHDTLYARIFRLDGNTLYDPQVATVNMTTISEDGLKRTGAFSGTFCQTWGKSNIDYFITVYVTDIAFPEKGTPLPERSDNRTWLLHCP